MKALLFNFILTALIGLPTALARAENSQGDTSVDTIIAYAAWSKLTPAKQEIYLVGVQKLVEELDRRDALDHVEYQSAPRSTSRDSAFLNWIVQPAAAADSGKRCVYAGWVSEMDINGRYCLAPTSGTCGQGQIQCNPLLYGEGKCTKTGRSATSFCNRSAKSPTAIAAEIRAKGKAGADAWAALQTDIGGYCASPRPTQKTVCSMIRTQVVALKRIVGQASAEARSETAQVEPQSAQVEPTRAAAAVRQHIVAIPVPAKPRAQLVLPPEADPTARKPAPAAQATDALGPAPPGVCNSTSLLGNMKYSGEPAAGWNFLDIADAQTLMCQRDPIPPGWYKAHRDRAESKIKNAPTADKWQKENKSSLSQLFKNFDLCYREALRLRKSNAPENLGTGATLTYLSNGFVDLRTPSKVISSGNGTWDIESMLLGEGISLCNVRTIDPNGALRQGAQKGLSSPGSSSSAQ